MKEKNKLRGKKARDSGARFELKVRKDLESKGWFVDKWNNNVDLAYEENKGEKLIVDLVNKIYGKLIPAKNKFIPGRVMMLGAGFPDFVIFRPAGMSHYIIYGVEVKSNGYLDPKERKKCRWLLDNNVFSKILIAKKGKKRGEIIYEDVGLK